jgi:23S rRNA (guanine1835-N2)-methyltransferase
MPKLEISDRSLTLERIPKNKSRESLQAFDAVDEYLLQQPLPPGPVVIFNDTFGALTAGLHPREIWHSGDSFVSECAIRHNLKLNNLTTITVHFLNSLTDIAIKPAAVILRIPKSMAFLEYQLQQIGTIADKNTLIIAGAKARDIHRSTLALFEATLGPTRTSLAYKKARLVFSQFSLERVKPFDSVQQWTLRDTGWTINNHANVYSRQALDPGARLFLAHLPKNLSGKLLDLGCGNGVLGMRLLELNPEAQVDFIDESWMAVASSQLNVTENMPNALARSHFVVNHSLLGYPSESLQAVCCNPPFHQHYTLTDNIAWQMFVDAKRCLELGGELRIVGNRHLDYHRKLKKLFGNCHLLASDARFVVLQAKKSC